MESIKKKLRMGQIHIEIIWVRLIWLRISQMVVPLQRTNFCKMLSCCKNKMLRWIHRSFQIQKEKIKTKDWAFLIKLRLSLVKIKVQTCRGNRIQLKKVRSNQKGNWLTLAIWSEDSFINHLSMFYWHFIFRLLS